MKAVGRIIFGDSSRLSAVPSASVDLIVTSPPYPMIEMWDGLFQRQNQAVGEALAGGRGPEAFELMHGRLDPVWQECHRVLKAGGLACVNVGDAARTLGGSFGLYSNHTRIMQSLLSLGFTALPAIIWRKQTNAPNKFMGSGMLPAGAYVTLEHEFILIVRKGPRRAFTSKAEKRNRRESAFFWEERNAWFSDVWLDIKGAGQDLNLKEARLRSAAYPFELAYRLISMFSVKGDTVLDPFLGTGTTLAAALAAGRNGLGCELDESLAEPIRAGLSSLVDPANARIKERLSAHIRFVRDMAAAGRTLRHVNRRYGFPVMTGQERDLLINDLDRVVALDGQTFEVTYSEEPQAAFQGDWPDLSPAE